MFGRPSAPRGGTIEALVVDPLAANTVYAATPRAGAFVSRDGGANWRGLRSGLPPTWLRALAIDPLHPNILYVGGRTGVYRSADSGETWQQTSQGPAEMDMTALAIDPRTPSTLYVGTAEGGVYRSTDGEEHWGELNSGLLDLEAQNLVIGPDDPSRLYVAGQGGLYTLRVIDQPHHAWLRGTGAP